MGMYLSKYNILHSLGYGDRMIQPEAQKILAQFNLFSFIIHDPVIHIDFHNQLKNSFDLLDYLYGNGFLFFALVDPPVKSEKYEKRDYFELFNTKRLLSPYNSYITSDNSITAYTLAQSLGIEYNDLPVLVISKDLQSREFTTVKTCSNFLEKQIQQIGYRCQEHKFRNSVLDIPEEWGSGQ